MAFRLLDECAFAAVIASLALACRSLIAIKQIAMHSLIHSLPF